jgi:anti-anti-sigma factor
MLCGYAASRHLEQATGARLTAWSLYGLIAVCAARAGLQLLVQATGASGERMGRSARHIQPRALRYDVETTALTAPAAPDPATGDLLIVTAAPADEHDTVVVLRVVGEIDLATVSTLRQHLTDHLAAPGGGLVIDLTAVTFLAGCGLGVLVETAERAHASGTILRLVTGDTRAVLRPLEATGLAETIPRADGIADAVRMCTG